ncbi:hypothetical protein QC762_0092350 [Podospora pseudocomata]|uniref:Uncharacterized protein n=1 Tax=Podospora pseudocomata TaxID=2093779 RepID=A0ABR0G6R2_9PEZI|nr:hypothetical protein QC762_0092350 [Podospora pseudocomata]
MEALDDVRRREQTSRLNGLCLFLKSILDVLQIPKIKRRHPSSVGFHLCFHRFLSTGSTLLRGSNLGGSRPVPTSAAADLFDFGNGQTSHFVAVKLGRRLKDDSFDLQVQPHADGVAGDQVVVLVIWIVEERRLLSSCFRRQTAVHDGASLSGCLLDTGLELVQCDTAEGNDRIAFFQIPKVSTKRLGHGLERVQALVPVNDAPVADPGAEVLDQLDNSVLSAEMKLFGLQAQNSLCPGPSAVLAGDHLNLVNDGHIHRGDISTVQLWNHLSTPSGILTSSPVTRAHGLPLAVNRDQISWANSRNGPAYIPVLAPSRALRAFGFRKTCVERLLEEANRAVKLHLVVDAKGPPILLPVPIIAHLSHHLVHPGVDEHLKHLIATLLAEGGLVLAGAAAAGRGFAMVEAVFELVEAVVDFVVQIYNVPLTLPGLG